MSNSRGHVPYSWIFRHVGAVLYLTMECDSLPRCEERRRFHGRPFLNGTSETTHTVSRT